MIIKHLKEIFARFGISKSIRTYNGPQFISEEFNQYCFLNNVHIIRTPPYWPQANLEVENVNRAICKRLKIYHNNGSRNYRTELQDFVLLYNGSPHSTTGKTPSELIFGKNIRNKISSVADLVEEECDEEARERYLINKQKEK